MNELPAGEPTQPERTKIEASSLDEVFEQALDGVRREAREVALMLEQSQAEVNRLGQKSTSVVAYVKQMREREQWEEMASACETALEAQQRYLIMRGQMEKLQQLHEALTRFEDTLNSLWEATKQVAASASGGGGQKPPLAMLEMLVQAQESERQRLSRQMHDGPAQTLSNFILQTEIAARLFEVDPDRARQELQNLKNAAAATFQEIREFIFELRPMMLDDLGLVPTLKRYLEALNAQTTAVVDFKMTGQERRYASYLEVFVFRGIQELVSSALHERKATRVSVAVNLDENKVRVEIVDDGAPIDTEAIEEGTAVSLRLLRERVEMLGGEMTIDYNPSAGNTVIFTVQALSEKK